MSHALAPRTLRGYTRAGLHEHARPLHRPRILWLNPAWLSVGAGFLLSALGIAAIAGTTEPELAWRQSVHLLVGLLAGAIAAAPHYRVARDLSYLFMGVVLVLLVFVLVPWVPEDIVRPRNGSRRWINLLVTDFQPSELAKIAYVLALANYLRYRQSYRSLRGLLVPLGLTFVPLGLVLVEPDLGTSLLFLPTFFAMLAIAGARLRHLLLVILIGAAAAPLLYPALRPHQKNRIKAMVAQVAGDSTYEKDIGFQGAQAMTLVGAGQLAGVGREKSASLVTWNRLPEDHNDMIFAVIACRWGALGALVLFGLFAAYLAGGLLVAAHCKDPFGRLVAVGLVAVVFAQMTVNIGMTLGLMPITGMTLPFVSYGGSSLLCTWLTAGLLLNIGLRRPLYMAREPFEFERGGEGE